MFLCARSNGARTAAPRDFRTRLHPPSLRAGARRRPVSRASRVRLSFVSSGVGYGRALSRLARAAPRETARRHTRRHRRELRIPFPITL